VCNEHGAPRVAALLLGAVDSAEGDACSAHGVAARHPIAHILVGFALEVEAQLVVELALEVRAAKDRSPPVAQVAPEFSKHECLSLSATWDAFCFYRRR